MKRIISLAAAFLLLALPCFALADATVTSTTVLERSAYLCGDQNYYYSYKSGQYFVYDAQGNTVLGPYGDISPRQDGLYYEVTNENGLNTSGVVDITGAEILPMAYGDILFASDDWMLGIVLEKTDAEKGDYKDYDGNQYNIARTDVVYKNQIIGSLNHDEFNNSYSYGAEGAYLYVRFNSSEGCWYDSSFNRVDVKADYFSTGEFTEEYKKGVLHNPTQTYAFTPGCTLTADQVEQPIWYNDDGDFIDLQGNVITQGPADTREYDYMSYYGGDYIILRANSNYGLMTIDGQVIFSPKYDQLAGYSDGTCYASGYQAVMDDSGALYFLDKAGSVTASVSYNLTENDYKGFYYNAPIIAVNGMGSYHIITATHGELPTKYEDADTVRSATQRIISVQKDGLWGCIDMAGNEVIPFVHRSYLEISADGTMALGTTENREYMLYTLSYTDDAAAAAPAQPAEAEPAPAANDGQWTCSCGSVNNGKFCPECGTAKPADVLQCTGCGYTPAEGETPKFCPECGTKF